MTRPLSMPPIDDDTMRGILAEVGGPRTLQSMPSNAAYEPVDGPRYDVSIEQGSAGLCMSFRPWGQPAASVEGRTHEKPARARATEARGPGPIPEHLRTLLERASVMGFEDVILSSGTPARVRVAGRVESSDTRVDTSDIDALMKACDDPVRQNTVSATGSADFALEIETSRGRLRYRVNLFRHQHGSTAVLRPVRTVVPTLRELGLPSDMTSLAELPHGLVLVTGPAGSGKSSTMAALVEHVNQTREKHIITLEDPIEFLYTPERSLIHQREVGGHVQSFSSGLRAALRESPDIIVVGEMRDTATMEAALTAAETGHLVLSTVHAATTTMAVERLVGAFQPHEQARVRSQVAIVLRAVVAQMLLPSVNGDRRVVAFERLIVNHAAATKIREDRCHQLVTVLQSGRGDGMVPFSVSIAQCVSSGRVARDVALRMCPDPEELRKLMRG